MPAPKSLLTIARGGVRRGHARRTGPRAHRGQSGRRARRVSGPLDSDAPPTRPEPARRLGDIVANSASYGTDLVVTTKFRNLAAIGYQEFTLVPADLDRLPGVRSLDDVPGRRAGQEHRATSSSSTRSPTSHAARRSSSTGPRARSRSPSRLPASATRTGSRVGNGVFFDSGDRVYSDDARREGAVTDEAGSTAPSWPGRSFAPTSRCAGRGHAAGRSPHRGG